MDIGWTTPETIMKSPSWKHQKSLDSSVPVSENVKTHSGGECIYPVRKRMRHSTSDIVVPETASSCTAWRIEVVRPYGMTDSSTIGTGASKDSKAIDFEEDDDVKDEQPASLKKDLPTNVTETETSEDGAVNYNEEYDDMKGFLIAAAIKSIQNYHDKEEAVRDYFKAFSKSFQKHCDEMSQSIKKMTENLAMEIPKRNASIVEKNGVILDIKNQMTSHKQHIASLEMNSEESSENRKAKIIEYKEKLELLAGKMKVYERETFELNKEIYEYLNKLLNMNLEKEKLKRLSAEADLSMLKVEDALKKGEHEVAMAEYESFKVRFEEECPRFEE